MRIVDNHLKAEISHFRTKMEVTPTPTSPALIADMKISDMGSERMTTETVRFIVPVNRERRQPFLWPGVLNLNMEVFRNE